MSGAIASYVVGVMAILLVALVLTVRTLQVRTQVLTTDLANAQGITTHLQRTLTTVRTELEHVRASNDALRASNDALRDELERNHYLRDVAEDELRENGGLRAAG